MPWLPSTTCCPQSSFGCPPHLWCPMQAWHCTVFVPSASWTFGSVQLPLLLQPRSKPVLLKPECPNTRRTEILKVTILPVLDWDCNETSFFNYLLDSLMLVFQNTRHRGHATVLLQDPGVERGHQVCLLSSLELHFSPVLLFTGLASLAPATVTLSCWEPSTPRLEAPRPPCRRSKIKNNPLLEINILSCLIDTYTYKHTENHSSMWMHVHSWFCVYISTFVHMCVYGMRE
jgi:hypothetical protein